MQPILRNQSIINLLLLFLISVSISCSSLRNEVSPSLLGVEPSKLVVTCFLSPQDTILAVKVTRSSTVVGDSISLLQTGNNVTDAIVTLTDGSQSVTLKYNNILAGDTVKSRPYYSNYIRLLPIIVGHTYTLSVVTSNGQRATSTCTIPTPVSLKDVTLDSLNRRYFVRARWQDPAGETNYYQVSGVFRYVASNCKNCSIESTNNLTFDDDNRGLFSDAGVDGSLMISGRAYLTSTSTSNFYGQYNRARAVVNLLRVDPNYYRFQEAIIRQRRSRNNPFAEPVLIPSNIDGGLGCFAGYSTTSLSINIK
ncbi:hypothetical protein GCM10028807_08240 [Spirosoma daeguense]